ncbi:hypothetical protein CCMA1212_007807, partial [Trichoderma ghanense]
SRSFREPCIYSTSELLGTFFTQLQQGKRVLVEYSHFHRLAAEHAASGTVHQSRSIYRLPLSVKAKKASPPTPETATSKPCPVEATAAMSGSHTVPIPCHLPVCCFPRKPCPDSSPPQLAGQTLRSFKVSSGLSDGVSLVAQPTFGSRKKGKIQDKEEELVIGSRDDEAFTTTVWTVEPDDYLYCTNYTRQKRLSEIGAAAAYLGKGTISLCETRLGFNVPILQMSQAAISHCWEAVSLSQHNLIKE